VTEWREGLAADQPSSGRSFLASVDTLEGLTAKLPEMRAMMDDAAIFRRIYLYTFGFAKASDQKSVGGLRPVLSATWNCRPNCGQALQPCGRQLCASPVSPCLLLLPMLRDTDLDVAIQYWQLLLEGKFALLTNWVKYLEVIVARRSCAGRRMT